MEYRSYQNKKSSFGSKRPSLENKEKKRVFEGAGKITRLEYQKTNPDRVNVFLDDQYAFSLAAILVADRQLRAGVELSRETVAELQTADFYNKELASALQQLASRPHSESEIQLYLKKKYPEAPAETSKQVIERLKELQYLNDASFAKFWVENRAAFSPRGRNLLKQELMKKRVPRDIIEAVIQTHLEAQQEEADEEGDNDGVSVEESQALEQARKKARSYAAEDWAGFYRKLGGFLLRRGYDYGITGRVTKQVWQELKNQSSGDDEEETEEEFYE